MPPDSRPGKVNDIHTADVSFRLAEELKASFIVNERLDRNELDLNRISQVSRRAPWFFALIEHLLTRILERHRTALVLFVHGWNVTQPRCDVGIGTSIADEDECVAVHATVTVSQEFLRQRLRRFRRFCEAAGIRATYGERYPASHPNNVLQIFRRTAGAPQGGAVGRIAEWAAARRIEAVQLELGVAVRWPGPERDSFVAMATQAFGAATPPTPASRLLRPRRRPSLSPPASLQCFDAASGIGVSAALSVESDTGIRGRLLLFLGGQRVALFVGEDRRRDRLVSGGPDFQLCERGFRLGFEGTILCVEDGGLYLDLEEAFAASTLRAARVELLFEAAATVRYGRVQGTVGLDQRAWTLDCHGFGGAPIRTPAPARGSQTLLSAGFGADLGLQLQAGDPSGATRGAVTRIVGGEEWNEPLHALSVSLDQDGYTPSRISVPLPGGDPLVAEPLNRMSIHRSGARPTRVTFGIARMRIEERQGFGFYEHSRPLHPPAR